MSENNITPYEVSTIRCSAMLFSENLIVDKESEQKSLINLFDTLLATEAPVAMRCFLFLTFTGIKDDVSLLVRATSPTKKITPISTFAIDYRPELMNYECVLKLEPIIFEVFGTYTFDCVIDENIVASKAIQVQQTLS